MESTESRLEVVCCSSNQGFLVYRCMCTAESAPTWAATYCGCLSKWLPASTCDRSGLAPGSTFTAFENSWDCGDLLSKRSGICSLPRRDVGSDCHAIRFSARCHPGRGACIDPCSTLKSFGSTVEATFTNNFALLIDGQTFPYQLTLVDKPLLGH